MSGSNEAYREDPDAEAPHGVDDVAAEFTEHLLGRADVRRVARALRVLERAEPAPQQRHIRCAVENTAHTKILQGQRQFMLSPQHVLCNRIQDGAPKTCQ